MSARDRVLDALRAGNVSVAEAAETAHVHWITASKHINRARDAGLAHVSGWQRSPTSGNPTALYTLGPGRNKRRPKRFTTAEKCAHWREKNRGLIVAKRSARKQPANPFSSIYLGL